MKCVYMMYMSFYDSVDIVQTWCDSTMKKFKQSYHYFELTNGSPRPGPLSGLLYP